MAGVVNVGPVDTGEPPEGVVYQLKVAFGVLDEAVKVAVCPAFTAWVGGVTAISGIVLTVMVTCALEVEVQPLPPTPST